MFGALAVASTVGLGATGIALAATSSSGSVPLHHRAAPSQAAPATTAVTAVPGPDQAGQGQANSEFTPPGETVETPDPGEATQVTEAEPANDPEPNHQDPNGVNVDHTPAGEQPEPAGSTNQG